MSMISDLVSAWHGEEKRREETKPVTEPTYGDRTWVRNYCCFHLPGYLTFVPNGSVKTQTGPVQLKKLDPPRPKN